jgi:hypothetical protein
MRLLLALPFYAVAALLAGSAMAFGYIAFLIEGLE